MNDPLTRQADIEALEGLGKSGDPGDLPRLTAALKEPDPLLRQVAATALGRLGDLTAVTPLIGAMADPDARVRQAAAWALGSLRDKRATFALTVRLNDPDPAVVRSAQWALAQLGEPVVEPHTHRRRRRSRRARRWMLGVGAGLIVAGVGLALLAWNQALGPRLVSADLSEYDPIPPTQAAYPQKTPVCGGPPVMTVLLVGLDSGEVGYEQGFADVIRVTRIDFTEPSAIILAIPRDLWLAIPGMAEHGVAENRVKTAYTYGEHYHVPGGGISLLAQTLSLNLGLTFDRYLATDFAGFARGIDALGGVDVALTDPVGQVGAADYFPVGVNHLDSARALILARTRPLNSSDLQRIERQTLILKAVRDKALSPEQASNLPALIQTMRQATRTDLSPSEISSLVCVAQRLDGSATRTLTLSGKTVLIVQDSFGFERLMPDDERIREAIHAFRAGNLSALEALIW